MIRKVGTYELGRQNVDLYVDTVGNAASFVWLPNGKSPPRMTVGVEANWEMVVTSVLHEAMEGSICQVQGSYSNTHSITGCPSRRLFVIDHEQFTEVCDMKGRFVTNCFPDLSRVYAKLGGRRKK